MPYHFHHIAIACNSTDKTAKKYEAFGYKKGATIWDDIQKVNICFLEANGMPAIELISSNSEISPIQRILKMNGVSLYHMCFTTTDIEESILELSQQGFLKLAETADAVAINGKKVVFMYNTESGLIELVESHDK